MSKLPKQLYVTAKIPYKDEPPLGFLNAYEPSKATFAKKRKTQEDWAYQGYYIQDFKLEVHGTDTYATGWRWVRPNASMPGMASLAATGAGAAVKQPVHELLEHPPQIWDNTPMTGFKVERSVSRCSTSNKLWRIKDPRGIEFEISTACMEQIIEDATILKGGIIDAKCAWMANKNLVVVP